jgi:hypothetical protein
LGYLHFVSGKTRNAACPELSVRCHTSSKRLSYDRIDCRKLVFLVCRAWVALGRCSFAGFLLGRAEARPYEIICALFDKLVGQDIWIQICDVKIIGVLDLDDALIPFPIRALRCVFKNDIRLEQARIPSLSLINCSVKSIKAAGAHIEGEAELNEGFRATGEVNFVGAVIDGALDFQGARLYNPKGITLYANRAKIRGSLYLRRNFKSKGEINITRATIGSNLDCADSLLVNPHRQVLNATSTEISGNVLFRKARVTGAINLSSAKVEGFVTCEEAQLISRKPGPRELASLETNSRFHHRAFIANSAKING